MLALEDDANHIFEFILENGGDLKAQDKDGNTILHRALLTYKVQQIKTLLKLGVDIEIRNYEGESPLMCAVRSGYSDVIKLLINKGADLF